MGYISNRPVYAPSQILRLCACGNQKKTGFAVIHVIHFIGREKNRVHIQVCFDAFAFWVTKRRKWPFTIFDPRHHQKIVRSNDLVMIRREWPGQRIKLFFRRPTCCPFDQAMRFCLLRTWASRSRCFSVLYNVFHRYISTQMHEKKKQKEKS